MATENDTSPDLKALYEEWYAATKQAADELGYPLGFNPPLLSSVEAFNARPRLLVATLNPAGDRDYPEHRGLYRYEHGNAYVAVDWKGRGAGREKLQVQMQHLMDELRKRVGYDGSPAEFARAHVVTTQAIPFRSPNEKSLHRPAVSRAFARHWYERLFSLWRPQAIFALGGTTADLLSDALGGKYAEVNLLTGWSNVTMSVRDFGSTRLLRLPHLSRYTLFGNAKYAVRLKEALDIVRPLICIDPPHCVVCGYLLIDGDECICDKEAVQ